MCGQSEDLIHEVRHVLCQARDDGVKANGSSGRSLGQQNADDTAIVQSVGAPFAALQWREEDSVNNFRCDVLHYLFAASAGVDSRCDRRTQQVIEHGVEGSNCGCHYAVVQIKRNSGCLLSSKSGVD